MTPLWVPMILSILRILFDSGTRQPSFNQTSPVPLTQGPLTCFKHGENCDPDIRGGMCCNYPEHNGHPDAPDLRCWVGKWPDTTSTNNGYDPPQIKMTGTFFDVWQCGIVPETVCKRRGENCGYVSQNEHDCCLPGRVGGVKLDCLPKQFEYGYQPYKNKVKSTCTMVK